MDTGTLIIQLLTVIGLLIPICTLIWKAAKQTSKIEEHEKRLEKLEVNYQQDMEEIKTSLNQLNLEFTKSFTELATKLNIITDSLKESK